MRLWPRSLGTRTAAVMVITLAVVQIAGLTIHALDRVELQRLAQIRDVGVRVMSLYRAVALAPPEQRADVLQELERRDAAHSDGMTAALSPLPPIDDLLPQSPIPLRRPIVVSMGLVPVPQPARYRELVMLGDTETQRLLFGMHVPDGPWLVIHMPLPPPRVWHSRTFLAAFLLMTAAGALISWWAISRLTAPVRMLANAAEALGRDVRAPPLPEDGPSEIAAAAVAFNTMAMRIRRFVQDRTFMLTAIGHDLRTPITRLKLRTEFIDDEDMRRKMLTDLDELESMVSATLAFGRDVTIDEPVGTVDLAELVRTVLDEAGDGRPDLADHITYAGPHHLPFRGRPVALKRAVSNLVQNALSYGGSAQATLQCANGMAQLLVEDDGPGIPMAELDRVFQPFHRVEASRNKETGGMGLGLPITRNIIRAHGGDVTLDNRPTGGARATVTLPV